VREIDKPVIPQEVIDLGYLAIDGTDADWFRETGHCGGCGNGPDAGVCHCAGRCGCADLHPVPATPPAGHHETGDTR
jgi:hypothetical protein